MKKIFFLTLVLLSVFALVGPVWAIGQITEPINIESAMRGQEIVSGIKVLNSENEQNVITLEAEGDITDWTSFYAKDDAEFQNPITEVTVAAGVYMDVGVLFRVPEDAANGAYEGKLSVMYNPSQASGGEETSSVVSQKISRSVTITVSDEEKVELEASVIPEKFDYAAGEPISVRVIYDNRSNISLTPSIQFKITQDEKTVYNVIYPYPDNEPAVRSMSLREIPALSIPTTGLAEGDYTVELNFMRGPDTILTKYFSFTLGSGSAAVNGIMDFKNSQTIIIIAVVVLLAVVIAVGVAKKSSGRGTGAGN